MRVLILGGSGMLGHKLWQNFSGRFDTYATFRQSAAQYARSGLFDSARSLGHVSAQDFDSVTRALAEVRPRVVVNCIGIVKQDAAAKDPFMSISVNALFPHRLAGLCRATGARLVHISTDCVFAGRRGNYSERDASDAEDLYGRTKLLGEVEAEGALTIRTSMIGRELAGAHGLVEWFLSQEGQRVRGFRRAVFSGFTTGALADIIADVIVEHAELHGVWNVAAEPINKFDLLSLVREIYRLDVEIEPDDTFVCDRSLDAARFRAATGFTPPTWAEMIERMRRDTTPYEELRRNYA
ncbi:MAG TPA: SDR family oxidoreductase [Pyrinomonadaceae bacterium]|jgi:dTDP-4-dehydrorhamnose reductase|nr:SDR family oxidoreductase [Pyrinomonadaceae bacterium]